MIRAHEADCPTGAVRVVIELPQEDGSDSAGYLTGTGRVVRTQDWDMSDEPSFAIAVKQYRVQRRDNLFLSRMPQA